MKKNKYAAARGAQFPPEKAQQIGECLQSLGTSLKPDDVVEAASRKRSPLHDLFEWDDTTAAHMHRLSQARHLLNHIEVVVTIRGKQSPTRAFHSLTVSVDDEIERRYIHDTVVVKSPALARQAVERAKADLSRWRKKYKKHSDYFAPVFEAIDSVVD